MVDERHGAGRVRVIELPRGEALCVGAWHAIEMLEERAHLHRRVVAMLVIDRYSYSYRHGTPIDPRIRDARELLLRFESALSNPSTLVAEPHAMGVVELDDRFVLSATVSHQVWINEAMACWLRALHGVRHARPSGGVAARPSSVPHGSAQIRTDPTSGPCGS